MSYIGSGANLVGGIMQSIAASQAQRAMFDEFEREQERQAGYSQRATRAWQPTLLNRSVETARDQMATGEGERNEGYADVLNSPFGLNASVPQTDRAYLDMTGANKARLGSYNDWQLEQAINNIRANEVLNRISNFAGGTANVFPYRMYEAQHSWDELAFWGKLIASIGGSAGDWSSSFGGSGPQGGYFGPQGGDMGYNWGYQSPSGSTLLWNNDSTFNPLGE